jgi:sigma-E factor negative regulatory protein RseC
LKKEEGYILETNDRTAKVRLGRHSDCIACGACPSAKNIVVEAQNPLQARAGQKVVLGVQEKNVIQAAFMVFIMPLLAAAVGAWCGAGIADVWGVEPVHGAIFGAFVLLGVAWAGMKSYDRQMAKRHDRKPVIVAIVDEGKPAAIGNQLKG